MANGELRETAPISALEGERQSRSSILPFSRSAADGGTGGVPCAVIGDVPIALDTLRWQMGQALRLTTVMKVDFCVDPLRGTSKPAAWPPRFNTVDVHCSSQQRAHVSAASDRAPWKRNVDVTLLGHARTAFGRPLSQVALMFSGRERGRVYFERRAQAVGDRATKDSKPEPFVTMPVVYERAYGGPGTPANPIGTGDAPGAPLPNIVDAVNPWRPAAFGPIASDWPVRSCKLGALQRSDLEEPVLVLPTRFDVSYFQSAPAEQQVPELGPTATFVLEGFHRERPRVEIGLPRAWPAGAVYGLSPEHPDAPSPLHFRIDTVHIEAQVWVLTLTYRACVELPDEATFDRLRVAAGLSMEGRPCAAPETWQGTKDGPVAAREARPEAPRAPDLYETRELPPSSPGVPKALPFGELRSPFVESPPPSGALPAEPEMAPRLPVSDPPPPEEPAPPAEVQAPRADLSTTPATPAAPPERTPAKDPYGQVVAWASGAEAREAPATSKPAPRPRPERKFNLHKGFGKR